MDRERRLNLLIVVLTLFAIFAVPYVVVKTAPALLSDSVDCDEFQFDREEWTSGDAGDRERQAEGLDKCDYLVGLHRGEVAAMLDEGKDRHPNPERWPYFAGETNDYLGPGDGVTLNVYFGEDGTVTRARLSQPLD